MDKIECRHNHGVGCMDPYQCATCGWNPAEAQRRNRKRKEREPRMTYFAKITASMEALAEFLSSIPALDTPWDELFQRTYCAACSAEECDGSNCPHQPVRNNPLWFLAQEVEDDGNDPVR